jgi:hypothetical protein
VRSPANPSMAPTVKSAHRGIPKKVDSFFALCLRRLHKLDGFGSRRRFVISFGNRVEAAPNTSTGSAESDFDLVPFGCRVLYLRPRKSSVPRRGLSKWRVLVRRRSQLGDGSNRGRLPTSLVISLRIGKSSAQARRSNPNAWGRARWRSGTTAGSASQIKVPFTRAALVCPSSATGSRRPGRASSATTSWHPPCNHPAFFPPHRTFTQAEVWCGGKNAAPPSRQTSQRQFAKTRLSSNTSRLRHR